MDKNIFTVGDTVQVRGDRVGTIEAFTTSNQYNTIVCQIRFHATKVENIYLADIQHYKKPLFTTEDGKEIFENGLCWVVGPNIVNSYAFKWEKPTKYPLIEGEKYFSTKEAAEEYILMNKPCLSAKDVDTFIDNMCSTNDLSYNEGTSPNAIERALKQLVKSKL